MVTEQYTAPVGRESGGDRTDPAAHPLTRTAPLVAPSQFESGPADLARGAVRSVPDYQSRSNTCLLSGTVLFWEAAPILGP